MSAGRDRRRDDAESEVSGCEGSAMTDHWIDDGGVVKDLSLAGVPSSIGTARNFVRTVLDETGAEEPLIDDAVLLASELATNAVIHAHSDFVVGVEAGVEWIWVGVVDHAVETAPRARRSSQSVGGRGLRIVDAVAPRWGTEPIEGSKIVWFALQRPSSKGRSPAH
jgi:anti-sigma regulatory factor (Ser/Thr protein kinase)